MIKKNALAFVQKDTKEQNKRCLFVKTLQSYSHIYFSSLEKHESLHKICYLNHIKFKIALFWARRRILDISYENKNYLFNSVSLSHQAFVT